MENQHTRHKQIAEERRNRYLDKMDERMTQREEIQQMGQSNWRSNQRDKRARQKRDLQLEMALEAKATQRIAQDNLKHRLDEEMGIESFESNLKRNGIGGDEGGGEDLMTPNAEPSDLFMRRIEAAAAQHRPSDAEVGDFMQNLQKRTGELRQARLEKARRKRRMQVEQRSALNDMNISSTSSLLDTQSGDMEETLTEGQVRDKAQMKAQKEAERTAWGKEHGAEMTALGETQLRIFCEQHRMMAYEANTSATKVAEVLAVQQQRLENKKVRNYGLCRTLVLEVLAEALSALSVGNTQIATAGGNPAASTEPDIDFTHNQLISEVVKLQTNRYANSDNQVPVLAKLSQSTASDILPSLVALANNAGKWRLDGGPEAVKVPSFRESAQTVFDEVLRYQRESGDQLCPFVIDAVEDLQAALATVAAPMAHPTEEDTPTIATGGKQQHIILVAGGSHDFSHETLQHCSQWLGGESACPVWDSYRAVEFAMKLLQLAADDSGPDLTRVNLKNLCEVFGIPREVLDLGKDTLEGTTLTPQTERTIADVVDIATRVAAAREYFSVDTAADVATMQLSAFKFSDCTLAILLAQVLWLRELVCVSCESACGSCPLSRCLLVSTVIGRPDRPIILRIFDWFLRGGSRLNLPDGDDEMAAEITKETATVSLEKGKKKPPPKKKDKNQVDTVLDKSGVSCLVWIADKPVISNPSVIDSETSEGASVTLVDDMTLSQEGRIIAAHSALLKAASVAGAAVESESTKSTVLALSDTLGCEQFVMAPAVEEVSPVGGEDVAVSSENVVAEDGDSEDVVAKDNEQDEAPILEVVHMQNNFSVVEHIVACVLISVVSHQSVPNEPSPEEKLPSILKANAFGKSVVQLVQSRREKISPAQRIYLLHEQKIRKLDFAGVREALCGLQVSGMTEIDNIMGVLFPAFVTMENVQSEVLRSRAMLIDMLKYPADHWRTLCVDFRAHLVHADSEFKRTNTSVKDITTFFNNQCRELECELGDINDARHQEWMRHIVLFDNDVQSKIDDVGSFLTELSNLLSTSLPNSIRTTADSAMRMAEVLERSGYSSFPWRLKYDLSKGGAARLEAQRIRDEIRHQSALLCSLSHGSNEDCGLWSEALAGLEKSMGGLSAPDEESPSFSVSLKASVIHETRSEHLTTAVSILKSLCTIVSSLLDVSKRCVQELTEYARIRNTYEHAILKKWMEELKKEFAEGGIAGGGAFISAYHFGVSNDSEADGVVFSSLSNGGMIDMNEMAINARKLKMLSLELLASRRALQQSSGAFSESEFLTNTVKNVFDHGENLPSNWRKKGKLNQLADAIGHTCRHLPRNAENFSRALVMRLLYAQLPCAPPSTYTVKLCAKLLGLNGDPAVARFLGPTNRTFVKLSEFLSAVSQDKVLCQGWWPCSSKSESDRQDHLTIVLQNIESIALLCADPASVVFAKGFGSIESATISMDDFVHVMSLSPATRSESAPVRSFQRSVCAAFTVSSQSSEGEMDTIAEITEPLTSPISASLPRLIQPGLSKLMIIAKNVVGGTSLVTGDKSGRDGVSDVEVGALWLRQLVFAPPLSPDCMRWVGKILGANDGMFVVEDGSTNTPLFGDLIASTGTEDAKMSI